MTKINITDVVTNDTTCSTINDMNMDIASNVADVAADLSNDVATNIAASR